MYILGISAYYHDSAAVLLYNDKIIAAVQEERFTRVKHDSNFPRESIKYCLQEASINLYDISNVVFYDKPFIKFERLLETYLTEAPRGFKSFLISIPIWLKDKLFLKETLLREFKNLFLEVNNLSNKNEAKKFKQLLVNKIMFTEHHQSHAASAFFPSPFEEAAILTVDGVGEWTTTSIAYGKQNKINLLQEINFPHSLGLLYSAFTYYLGFKVNSGEYKVMGLAPYGAPKYTDIIKNNLIDIKDDGSFKLDMNYFSYTTGLTMTNKKFDALFGGPVRVSESEITQREMDIAASIQKVTEEIMEKLARYAKKITGSENLCLAGGVALNCVSNGNIFFLNIFENIWIQPAAGDSGGALGAAYALYYQQFNNKRIISKTDKMQVSYLGPKFCRSEIKLYLESVGAIYEYVPDENKLVDIISNELSKEKIIGWHFDRMEFGPRALGHRSILGDARSDKIQSTINLKIKFRESFRPFAPSVLSEKVGEWFDLDRNSPYMLLVAPVKKTRQVIAAYQDNSAGIEKLKVIRSEIPAVTHVDYTARVQTVHVDTNTRYHKLISKFEEKTKCPVIVNTSFNIRGEPIVCSPEDSYKCFTKTNMDILVIDDFILYKKNQNRNHL